MALLWVVWALFFAMHNLTGLIGLIASSVVVYVCVGRVFPGRLIQVEEPQTTGNAALDALIAEGERSVAEMKRLNDLIPGEEISGQIDELENTTRNIFQYVQRHPEKLPETRKFMQYYLPTTLKLLTAYAETEGHGEGENISATRARVEEMMHTITAAFQKQLDSLFGTEALDISTDIKVLETMMAREGLAGGGTLRAERGTQF